MAVVTDYRRSSGRVRFQHYTLAALYFFAVMEAVFIAVWTFAAEGAEPPVRMLILLVGGVHVWLMVWLTRDGLRTYLHGAARPDRLLTAALTVSLLGIVMGLLLIATDRSGDRAGIVLSWFPMFFIGPALLVLPIGRGTALAAVPTGVAVLSALALDLPPDEAPALIIATLVSTAFMGVTFRSSAWTLRVVNELDAARETQSRLAVAEERLRFGRDMHDVLGRNLSVIALKSELAVQLAQRGSPAAVDQMTEVQRIARESQHEMRAVLRGYRDADLETEIAGARGVLEAAGIDCAVHAEPAGRLPVEVGTPLGWVVREGATNILRHSDAKRCTLRLRLERHDGTGRALLTMENDGVPAPGAEGRRPAAGSGLAGLRERLATVGGTLRAEPGPDGSFLLTARVPCRAPDHPAAALATAAPSGAEERDDISG
jgi:two-component system sensor histidine kinase DesK